MFCLGGSIIAANIDFLYRLWANLLRSFSEQLAPPVVAGMPRVNWLFFLDQFFKPQQFKLSFVYCIGFIGS